MKKLLCLGFLLSGFACSLHAQKNIPAYSADKLMARVSHKDTTYIVNFWASWCGPCVAELPQFTALENHYAKQKVKVLLVSLDFPDAYPQKLNAYVERKKIQPEIIWFNETNANDFIPKIDDAWSGALPATLIINKRSGYKQFLERMVKADEIIEIVSKIKK